MTVLTFQPQFVPRVEARTKRLTMRARRKRTIRTGQALSLRCWTGRPYMTPQRLIFDTVCVRSCRVIVPARADSIRIAGDPLTSALDEFAMLDGFDSWDALVAWFSRVHGLPFEGDLIEWRP